MDYVQNCDSYSNEIVLYYHCSLYVVHYHLYIITTRTTRQSRPETFSELRDEEHLFVWRYVIR
jgi:hypothetical protein